MKKNIVFYCLCSLIILILSSCGKSVGLPSPLGSDFKQETFNTPEDLVSALTEAVNSKDSVTLLKILGPSGKNLVFSGDPISDQLELEYLSQRLAERSELIPYVSAEFKDVQIMKLRVGKMGTNAGIPIINDGKGWRMASGYFAPRSIKRRMASNEIEVWRACMEYVEAQRHYFKEDRDADGILEYSQKLISSPGKKDGLFWPTKQSEPQSPLAEIVAKANAEGYEESKQSEAQHFHGYLFKILNKQGPKALGGQKDYIVNDNMTQGFALLAYPIEWGASGLRTFIVGPDGNIYGKNLGISTHTLVSNYNIYNPDQGWFWVQNPQVSEYEEYFESFKD